MLVVVGWLVEFCIVIFFLVYFMDWVLISFVLIYVVMNIYIVDNILFRLLYNVIIS